MNTELRKKAKTDSEKDFFKFMKNAVFKITMDNVRKYSDIQPVITKVGRNYFVS